MSRRADADLSRPASASAQPALKRARVGRRDSVTITSPTRPLVEYSVAWLRSGLPPRRAVGQSSPAGSGWASGSSFALLALEFPSDEMMSRNNYDDFQFLKRVQKCTPPLSQKVEALGMPVAATIAFLTVSVAAGILPARRNGCVSRSHFLFAPQVRAAGCRPLRQPRWPPLRT